MKLTFAVALLLCLACASTSANIFTRSSSSLAGRSDLVRTGTAFLRETVGVPSIIMGIVDFYQPTTSSEVIVDVFVYGNDHFLVNGESYGVHVHTYGDISERQGDLIGPHFVGNGYPTHACPPNPIRHAGDLGNFATTAEGTLNSVVYSEYLQTYASQNNSIIGRAVAVHAITDGCDSESYLGPKMAIGTVGIASDAPAGVGINFEPDVLVGRLTGTMNCFVCTGTVWVWKEDPDDDPLTPNTIIHVRGRAYMPPTPANSHGWTINQFGDISAKNGFFVGPHYDTTDSPHGLFPSVPRHLGDLGNSQYYVPQKNDEIVIAKWIDIEMPDIFDLKDIVGRSVVVHELMDRGTMCYEGGMGDAWAMGVLGIGSPDLDIPEVSKSVVLANQTIGWLEPCSSGERVGVAVFGLLFALVARLFM